MRRGINTCIAPRRAHWQSRSAGLPRPQRLQWGLIARAALGAPATTSACRGAYRQVPADVVGPYVWLFLLFRCPLRGRPAMIGVAARLPREPDLRHRHRPDFEGIATPPSRCALTPAGKSKQRLGCCGCPIPQPPRWGGVWCVQPHRQGAADLLPRTDMASHSMLQPSLFFVVLIELLRTSFPVRVSRTDAHLGVLLAWQSA